MFGEMPDSYAIVINTAQPAVKKLLDLAVASLEDRVTPLRAEIETLNDEISKARKEASDKKESVPADVNEKEKKVGEIREKKEDLIKEYAKEQPEIGQIIDLALLQSNLLKGAALSAFIRRSISLL